MSARVSDAARRREILGVEFSVENTFHYTDKDGWNGVRSQREWLFKASQPKDPNRPVGAYFTNIEPTRQNLKTLYKRIRVPKAKQQYIFWFAGREGLVRLHGGRGRDKWIYVSVDDYRVSTDRQRRADAVDTVMEEFQ